MKRVFAWLSALGERRALANAAWLFFDQGTRAVVVLAAFGAVARHLGPEQFGLLSYAVAFAGLFLPLAVIGLDYVVVMELVRDRAREGAVLATAGRLRVLAAVAAFAIALLAGSVVPVAPAVRPLLFLTAFGLLGQPFQLFDYWFQSHVASRFSVVARLGSCLLVNGARIAFVLHGAPVAWFAWLVSVEALVFGAGLLAAFRLSGGPRVRDWWRGYDPAVAQRLLAQAWPLFLADLAIVGYLRVDQLLLSHLAGSDQLGRYAAAFRLADAAEFFALALINSSFPRLVVLHKKGRAEFLAGLERFQRGITWFALAIAGAVSLAAPLITRLLLGEEFAGTACVLALLTWANVFVTIVAVRGKWFLLEGLQAYSLVFFAVGAGCHLVGVWLLAGRWGAPGAAVSFLVAQAVLALAAPLLFGRTRAAAFLALRVLGPRRT